MNKWTESEICALKNGYSDKKTVEEIAEEVGRTKRSVISKASKLGLGGLNWWTYGETSYLKENYKSYNLQEISEYLGRRKSDVCSKAKALGIERNHRKKENPQGRIPWRISHANLKKSPEELFSIRSAKTKKAQSEHGHPRGMLGKTQSESFKKDMSARSIKYWSEVTKAQLEVRKLKQRATKIKNGSLNPMAYRVSPYSRAKGGKREDLGGQFFRSSWEANIARYFNYVGIRWEYEPRTFIFHDIKNGSVSYTPDFYLPDEDRWVEIKGWMDAKSKSKLKRFEKQYPDEFAKLEIIGEDEYRAYKKWGALIPGWE